MSPASAVAVRLLADRMLVLREIENPRTDGSLSIDGTFWFARAA